MKKRGFTLIELIASLAIISILVVVIIQIFSLSLNTSKKSYEDEIRYKESSYSFIYIENVVRSAYKIEILEKETNASNFIAYVKSPNSTDISTYSFNMNSDDNANTYLNCYINNISNNSTNGKNERIGLCNDASIFYDDMENTIKIILNDNSEKFRYEGMIYLGRRL